MQCSQRSKIKFFCLQRLSLYEILVCLGCSYHFVYNILKEKGELDNMSKIQESKKADKKQPAKSLKDKRKLKKEKKAKKEKDGYE